MSFTVQEARAAFFCCTFALPRITLAVPDTAEMLAKISVGAHIVLATPAT
jgi:hypothetical protein